MSDADEALVCTFEVTAPPEELETWWTDLPEVYEAEDPREQPHRIELVEETEDGAIYDTYWRGPLGLEFSLTEELQDEGPGRWRFIVPNPGFVIEDRYTAEATDDGCRLTIRSMLTYTRWYGHVLRRLLMPGWKARFRETFSDAVDVFEEERER